MKFSMACMSVNSGEWRQEQVYLAGYDLSFQHLGQKTRKAHGSVADQGVVLDGGPKET